MRFRVTTLIPGLLVAFWMPASLLAQSGSVTGTVRAANGVPVPGIRVSALPAGSTDDRLPRAMSSIAVTDDAGRYRLENIPPGRYHIAAGRVDVPTYHPGTLDVSKATIFSITSAATISDIDIVAEDFNGVAPPAGRGGARGGGRGGRGAPVVPQPIAPPPPPAPPLPQGTRGRGAQPNANRAVIRDTLNVSPTTAAWWTNTLLVSRLGLTEDQKRRIEATFEQHRQALAQNKADLEREESTLARMLETEPIESTKAVTSQIERVIQSRGEMERTNSKMTLEMRQVLTRSQWVQLQTETQPVPTPTPVLRGRGQQFVEPTFPR